MTDVNMSCPEKILIAIKRSLLRSWVMIHRAALSSGLTADAPMVRDSITSAKKNNLRMVLPELSAFMKLPTLRSRTI